MLKNDAPRPTFLIPRVLYAAGEARPNEKYADLPDLLMDVVPDGLHAEAFWTALEPLLVVLNVAGYDTPEIVIGRWAPDAVANEYLRVLGWKGLVEGADKHVIVAEGDWEALVGSPLGGNGSIAIALRVQGRRWIEQAIARPSPYPPVALGGAVPEYHPDPVQPFAGANDGWITLIEPVASAVDTKHNATRKTAEERASALAGAIAAA